MNHLQFLVACSALFIMSCEPKLKLHIERHGTAYEFELRRTDDARRFEANSFGVMEGSRVICEIRRAPGPGAGVSRWTYGSRPTGYSISPRCEPLAVRRTYRASGGGPLFGVLAFRLNANGDVQILEH